MQDNYDDYDDYDNYDDDFSIGSNFTAKTSFKAKKAGVGNSGTKRQGKKGQRDKKYGLMRDPEYGDQVLGLIHSEKQKSGRRDDFDAREMRQRDQEFRTALGIEPTPSYKQRSMVQPTERSLDIDEIVRQARRDAGESSEDEPSFKISPRH